MAVASFSAVTYFSAVTTKLNRARSPGREGGRRNPDRRQWMADDAQTPRIRTLSQHSGAEFEHGDTGRPRGEQIDGVHVRSASVCIHRACREC